jgi:hypothetical protein
VIAARSVIVWGPLVALSALALWPASFAIAEKTPPTCVIAGPSSVYVGDEACFDGSQSYDADNCDPAPPCPGEGIVSYVWDFGDVTGSELVTNGDFEGGYTDGIADGWTTQEVAGGSLFWSDYLSIGPPTPPHGGSNCQVLYFNEETSGATDVRIYQTIADLTPGDVYRLSAWIALIGCGSAEVACQVGYDLGGGTDFTWLPAFDADGQWHQATADLIATGPAISIAYRWVGAPHPDEVCDYFGLADDASLRKLPTGSSACHTYANSDAGEVTVGLTVTDDEGAMAACTQQVEVRIRVEPPPVWVDIPLTETGWHMISLPLEPEDHNILLNRLSGDIDTLAVFYNSYLAGNDPRNRLFRTQPGVGYWTYNPTLYPGESWYEIGVEPPPGKPDPGPWWQGFWFLVEVPHTLRYLAVSPVGSVTHERFIDISASPWDWAWVMIGACARAPYPYQDDVTAWPGTSLVHDVVWGRGGPTTPPAVWLPTADCTGLDALHQGLIGLPLIGYRPGFGYYPISPSPPLYCGAPADRADLTPGEGYWLDVEDPEVWMRVAPDQR